MWSLVATVAAGLRAGASLCSIVTQHPILFSGKTLPYWTLFPKLSFYASFLALSLTAATIGASFAAYFAGTDLALMVEGIYMISPHRTEIHAEQVRVGAVQQSNQRLRVEG